MAEQIENTESRWNKTLDELTPKDVVIIGATVLTVKWVWDGFGDAIRPGVIRKCEDWTKRINAKTEELKKEQTTEKKVGF